MVQQIEQTAANTKKAQKEKKEASNLAKYQADPVGHRKMQINGMLLPALKAVLEVHQVPMTAKMRVADMKKILIDDVSLDINAMIGPAGRLMPLFS